MAEIVSGIWGKVRTQDITDRAVTRGKLEYPTENVSVWYLAIINKAELGYRQSWHFGLYTTDSFTDKAIMSFISGQCCCDNDARAAFASSPGGTDGHRYSQFLTDNASTADHSFEIDPGGQLGYEAVDLTDYQYYKCVLSASGSTFKCYRDDLTTPKITVTDTTYASGRWGVFTYHPSSQGGIAPWSGILLAPLSKLPKPIAIIETEVVTDDDKKQKPALVDKLVNITSLKLPKASSMHLLRSAKKYEVLKSKGFKDEEMKALLGFVPKHKVNLTSVTWGAFDHKPNHNTMLIAITSDNPYKKGAILKQIEHAKKKNLIVLKAPKDYSEAIEQYKQLKAHFPEWIAGKDNYAYHMLGDENLEPLAVADFYHGNMIQDNKLKDVPEWVLRRTLEMWKERLKKAKVSTEIKKSHMKKLEKCLKK